ncbi:trypsin-like peptidase domain-containing protein [Streptomyces kaniharaensis]|uniref:Trypsin-like peptidase domain-containing protein n=1 Tax=Streptomyces kaniharaensis TaxID=212423 RepID=A0A6N7KNM1_9ACTN|nr:trypsin-like peptidase domain-containing protein [Streptomyces kaniharaensis]MQS12048.1 trypsin-like peptidase domain-containing protein [Streptomyces kaniharaensis]
MRKPLIGALAAVLVAGATALTGAVPAHAAATTVNSQTATTVNSQTATTAAANGWTAAHPATDTRAAPPLAAVDFAGTVALSNCSGSLVRMPRSAGSDPALVLSNGHCLESGMPGPGEVVVDQPSSRTFTLLSGSGGGVATLNATKVVYGAMTDTDVSIYQLDSSYDAIQSQYGIAPLTVSAAHPAQGVDIRVVSGYWKRIYSCSVDGFAYQLQEADWTFKDSVRYTSGCNVIGGTSGSPVVDANTGQVVAVNNTINENGESCTLNNPCEVDQTGAVTVHQGIGYAQETYLLPACFAAGNRLDLTLPDCVLPRP